MALSRARSGRVAFGCDFVCGCWPGFPGWGGPFVWWGVGPVEGVVVFVEFGVASVAEECHGVDVGFACCWSVEWCEVVGLAAGRVGSALHAAFVSGDQRPELGWGCQPFAAAVEQDFAVSVEQCADEGCVAEQFLQ